MEAIHIINPLRESGGKIEVRNTFGHTRDRSFPDRTYIESYDGVLSYSCWAFNEATAVSIWNDKFTRKPRECV